MGFQEYSMGFQECVTSFEFVDLKNVLSHCLRLLLLHPSLSVKMVVDSVWTLGPIWSGDWGTVT